jgi:hypothetical protein
MLSKQLKSASLLALLLIGLVAFPVDADARHYRGYSRYNQGYSNRYYGRDRYADYQTGKILKGGLVGAGIGAGAGLLLDRPVGRTALVGAGVGAGTQAVRYSRTMRRHPIVKTAAYGALAGTGVSAATGRRLGKGALWGGAIGTGIGALNHL